MSRSAETREVDVVVIGSGAAGLFAALEATEAGAEALVLESEFQLGGSTRLSGGYVALCETDLEPGTRDELLADLRASHMHDADERLSQMYVDHAGATYRRLRELGLRFARTKRFAYMSRPWAHELPTGGLGGGAQIVEALKRAGRARGIECRLSSRAQRLWVEDDGRATGVETREGGRQFGIAARQGVILATGGFTRNVELIRAFGRPGTERIVPITGEGSRGDGLVMGLSIGAAVSYLGVGIAPTAPIEPESGKGHLPIYSGGIAVNRNGERFCDESRSYLDISWAGLDQPGALMIQIFDASIDSDYRTSMLGQVMSGGKQYSAQTLDELLGKLSTDIGLDAEQALRTVANYNDCVDRGVVPEFGRRHLLGSEGDLVRIESPPFNAAVTVPGTTHFNGGLRIDDSMRVLDWSGQPIPGLYAAGEATGGFHGAGYLSGSFVGMALIFGRLAGAAASGAELPT